MPYSLKILRTMNFAVFEHFPAALKINSLKHYTTEYYDSLVDLIHKIYHGEISSRIFSLENYLLYSR